MTVYLDIRTSDITIGEIRGFVDALIREHPDEEIYMDGERYAIVGRARA